MSGLPLRRIDMLRYLKFAVFPRFARIKHPETDEGAVQTLVVNGADDALVRPSAAAALARVIPDARPVVYPGMGHNVPEHLWTTIADTVAAHAGICGAAVR